MKTYTQSEYVPIIEGPRASYGHIRSSRSMKKPCVFRDMPLVHGEDIQGQYLNALECLKDDIEFMHSAPYALSEREYNTMRRLLDVVVHLHAHLHTAKRDEQV